MDLVLGWTRLSNFQLLAFGNERAPSTPADHSTLPRGMKIAPMNANRPIWIAAQRTQDHWGPISVIWAGRVSDSQCTLVVCIAAITLVRDSATTVERFPLLSTVSPPHHPTKGADSQIAHEPVYEPHPAPNLLWIWPPSLGKTDKSTIEGGTLYTGLRARCESAHLWGMMRWGRCWFPDLGHSPEICQSWHPGKEPRILFSLWFERWSWEQTLFDSHLFAWKHPTPLDSLWTQMLIFVLFFLKNKARWVLQSRRSQKPRQWQELQEPRAQNAGSPPIR